jgi:dienelactone hydrolase
MSGLMTSALPRGLTGVLAAPADPIGGVVVLGGSEGGFHERDAMAFAEAGFSAVAVAYFGAPGLPAGLKEVPIETVMAAIDVLSESVPESRIGLVGGSRGGELALLTASFDPRVSAVVSVVGSGVVTQGIDFEQGRLDRILSTPTPSWTHEGKPLPYASYSADKGLHEAIAEGAPIRLATAFPAVEDIDLDVAGIPVERIRGAVLLISASDDGVWPSAAYSRVAEERLSSRAHPFPHRHVVLEGAGHLIAGPPGDDQVSSKGPGPGVEFEYGGEPSITTAARREAWSRTIEFLHAELAGPLDP